MPNEGITFARIWHFESGVLEATTLPQRIDKSEKETRIDQP